MASVCSLCGIVVYAFAFRLYLVIAPMEDVPGEISGGGGPGQWCNLLCLDGRNTFLSLHRRVGHLYILTASSHALLVAQRFNAAADLVIATVEAVGAGGCIRQ
jgi:hypothetical protein